MTTKVDRCKDVTITPNIDTTVLKVDEAGKVTALKARKSNDHGNGSAGEKLRTVWKSELKKGKQNRRRRASKCDSNGRE